MPNFGQIVGHAVTPGYHASLGTRLLQGRDIEARDGPAGPFVVVVNEAFVAEFLQGVEPLGFQLRMPGQMGPDGVAEIVGVVENVIQARPEDGIHPAVYVPYTQAEWPFVHVVVRSDRAPDVLIPELRSAVARFSDVVPPLGMMTMQERMAASRTDPRFQSMLLGAFASVALLLASAGLFASLSHAVGRRSRELGIRMALGSSRRGVLRMVVLQGLRVAGASLVVGMVGAAALSRVLQSYLYQVDALDPLTLMAVGMLLALVAAGASLVPARRATTVDPVTVLREE